jgi:ATP-dependent helicase/nuclease subunit B
VPAGPPLLFLAPKQATFQIERQLLADPALPGFTRLRVVALDRLATEVLEESGSRLKLLTEEGRIMALRALLARCQGSMRIFRAAARMVGFACQLSLTLRDLRRYQLSAATLLRKAALPDLEPSLAAKLHDCALLLNAYEVWLEEHGLDDADVILDRATDAVGRWPKPGRVDEGRAMPARIQALWLDGFAEMTPQELDFLAALIPHCGEATLAFCLPSTPAPGSPVFSPWALVAGTFESLRNRLQLRPGIECGIELLPSDPERTRFAQAPALAHLERHWGRPVAFGARATAAVQDPNAEGRTPEGLGPAFDSGTGASLAEVSLFVCAQPEAEAVLAARVILDHVQRGGRFRDTAILLRSLHEHHAVFRRVLRRYEIPFFLDRRESVTHHPVAELTRYALRTLAFGWRHEDWFGALKTGLLPAGAEEIDRLENEALARGWEGARWREPLTIPEDHRLGLELEAVRARVLPPLEVLEQVVKTDDGVGRPSGRELAAALTGFWRALDVPGQLEGWERLAQGAAAGESRWSAIHRTVWGQMLSWAENLELAFPFERLSLQEWLPILESGLASLTVGAIPPALDQVLVGAIDRSRNPNLELVVVPGLNEGIFPAMPATLGLLTESDRRHLDAAGMRVGVDQRLHLAHERYYGYIACTRASGRLVLTYSERDVEGRPRLPSPLVSHLQRLFPELVPVAFDGRVAPAAALHPHELAPWLLAREGVSEADRHLLESIAGSWKGLGRGWLMRLREYQASDTLGPAAARVLHGHVLGTSVSALETFAACPFRFFVGAGLRAQERRRYEADAREQGSYQHEILARFHRDLSAQRLRWRDLDPDAAVQRVHQAADQVAHEYRSGLFRSNPVAACQARAMTAAVGDFVATTVRWMRACAFDPVAVELEFGTRSAELPPWTLDLGEGRRLEFRGKIDRIDLLAGAGDRAGWVLVLDYKSSRLKLDSLLLEHGIQLQLPAYLAAVRRLPGLAERFGQSQLLPAGAFYVGLRGSVPQAAHRREALTDTAEQNAQAYQHRGRYRLELLPSLDSGAPDHPSGQFHYAFNRTGEPSKRATDLLTGPQLEHLLDAIETRLIETGRRILDGDIRVDPYRHGQETACARCDFSSICRIDPWTHSFRMLQAGASVGTTDAHA